MKRLVLVLVLFTACHHHSKPKCAKIEYSATSCGSKCISIDTLRRAIEDTIRIYGERHGSGDVAARALRRAQVTWHEGDHFYDSVLCQCQVYGITYSETAIGIACRNGRLGNTAFFEECCHLVMWNIVGAPVPDDDPRWTPEHRETVRILKRMYQ